MAAHLRGPTWRAALHGVIAAKAGISVGVGSCHDRQAEIILAFAGMTRRVFRLLANLAVSLACLAVFASPANAAEISNPVATFTGLDKITARVTKFDVYINETVQFGSLQITPRVCYTRPATETQQRTSVFVEVDQVNLKGATQRIFTGWMFADSPALNAVDDPVYDFWLVECKQHTDLPPPTAINPPSPAPGAPRPGDARPASRLPPASTAETADPAQAPGAATSPPAAKDAGESSILTLLSPKPTAQSAPGSQ